MKTVRFLIAMFFSIALAACGGGGSSTPDSYGIAGTVTTSGAALAGATITLTGGSTTTTDASGNYSFTGVANGSYAVTATKTGYTFSPSALTAIVNGANVTGMNFTATALGTSHAIAGTVSGDTLSGVTVTVTGAATASATTDASGNYSVTGLYDGSYTVTPSKTGYTFNPASSAVTVSGANIAGKNFVATANAASTYSITGAVSGSVLSGVTITLSGAGSATTTTNASGNYTFSGLVNGNYTVTPSMSGYTFSPTSAAANVSGANISGTNFVATASPATYSQADLTGTWRVNMLRTGSMDGWVRATGTLDSSGLMTVSSFLESTGNSTPPAAGSMQWTISGSGVISESGVNAGSQVHMTMTSSKNFIAGTGSDGSSQLRVVQKVVPGTVYSSADLQNKAFVFHQLSVGSQYKWSYGAGTIDAAGAMTTTSETDPSGSVTPAAQGNIAVASDGLVTMSSGMASYAGFLSDDKKTIVGTYTKDNGGGNIQYRLMIVQITGQTYTAGPLPAESSVAHMLAGGVAPAPFWVHDTITIASGGAMTFSDWVSSNPVVTAPGTAYTGSISASGTVSIAGNSSYHGQASHDGKFTVGIQTITSGAYSLQVNTK